MYSFFSDEGLEYITIIITIIVVVSMILGIAAFWVNRKQLFKDKKVNTLEIVSLVSLGLLTFISILSSLDYCWGFGVNWMLWRGMFIFGLRKIMPINIYIEETLENLHGLCDDIWDLPTQIEALETWLEKEGKSLTPNKYVADIGFEMRKDASGGGGVLSSKSMKIMGVIGMDVYFSEYGNVQE